MHISNLGMQQLIHCVDVVYIFTVKSSREIIKKKMFEDAHAKENTEWGRKEQIKILVFSQQK